MPAEVGVTGCSATTLGRSPTKSNERKIDSTIQSDGKDEEGSFTGDSIDVRRLIQKIDLRIVPACMLIYILSFLDRSNIGNAKILNANTGDSLQQATHITNQEYLITQDIFLVAYALFEIPSGVMLKAHPAGWLAFVAFGWGATTMIQATVSSFSGLAGVRFVLGTFEAGIFSGIFYFFTFWYRPEERAFRIALIASCPALGGAFGGAIAYGIGLMNQVRGIQGWRWLSIFEGSISCASSIVAFLVLPNYPETARWLNIAERSFAVNRLQSDSPLGLEKLSLKEMRAALLDLRLYVHYAIFLCICSPFSGFSLFIPTIVSGLGFEGLAAQLFSVPPFGIAFVVTVVISWVADRYQSWSTLSLVCLVLSGISFIVQGAISHDAFTARYVMLCVAATFSFACSPLLINFLTVNIRGTSAATVSIPLNIAVGTAGQITGLYIYKPSEAPGYPTGHFTNAALMLLAAVLTVFLRWLYARRNRYLTVGEKMWRV